MKTTRRQLGILAFATSVITAIDGCERRYLLQPEKIPNVSEKYVFIGAIESPIYHNPKAGRIEMIAKNGEFENKPCLDLHLNIDADLSDFLPDIRFSARYHSKSDFDMNSLDFQIYEVSAVLAMKSENKKQFTYGWENKCVKDGVSLAYWGINLAKSLSPGEEARCKFAWDRKLEPEELEQEQYTCIIKVEKAEIEYHGQLIQAKKVIAAKQSHDEELNFYLGKLPGTDFTAPLKAETTIIVKPLKFGKIDLIPIPLEVKMSGTLDQEQSCF